MLTLGVALILLVAAVLCLLQFMQVVRVCDVIYENNTAVMRGRADPLPPWGDQRVSLFNRVREHPTTSTWTITTPHQVYQISPETAHVFNAKPDHCLIVLVEDAGYHSAEIWQSFDRLKGEKELVQDYRSGLQYRPVTDYTYELDLFQFSVMRYQHTLIDTVHALDTPAPVDADGHTPSGGNHVREE